MEIQMERTTMLSLFAAVLLAAPMICAQSQSRMEIPFPFTVDNTEHPAGLWTVSQRPANPHMLSFSREGGSQTFFASTLPAANQQITDASRIVFNVYEGKYFLSELQRAGKPGIYFAPGKAERALVAARLKGERVSVIAGSK